MTPTANQRILLQTDLGLLHPTPEQEVQLDHYLSMAHAAISREGVQLNPDALKMTRCSPCMPPGYIAGGQARTPRECPA